MTTNRRGFIASLLALSAAAVAALKSRSVPRKPLKQAESVRCCFNCHQWYAHPYGDTQLPDGVAVSKAWSISPEDVGVLSHVTYSSGPPQLRSGGIHCEVRVQLCNACYEAITNCATCGRSLEANRGILWLSTAGEPMRLSQAQMHGLAPHPPFGRDLIVADCPKCALLAGRISVNAARSQYGLPPLPDSIVVVDDPLTSGEIRNICYAFNVPPSQLL